MVGGIYDFFTLSRQVDEENMRIRYRDSLDFDGYDSEYPRRKLSNADKKESIERVILRTAKKNRGLATPSEVALEGDIPIEEAKTSLEKLASKGFCELRVRKSGGIVYVFPEFVDQGMDFEEF